MQILAQYRLGFGLFKKIKKVVYLDYYSRKSAFSRDLREYIMKPENANTKVSLAIIERRYAQRYGFSLKQILAALLPYERLGYALVTENAVYIHGKKGLVNNPTTSTESKTATMRMHGGA
jgi:hypothetical protein